MPAGLGYIRMRQLSAQITTSGGTSASVDVRGTSTVTVYLEGTGTITSGTVLLETADFDPNTGEAYTGTWWTLQSMTASDVTAGATKAYVIPGAFSQLRTRVSVAIGGGGSISTAVIAN